MAAEDKIIRRFTFNTIIVIESIGVKETPTGKSLYDDLIQRRTYQNAVLKVEYHSVQDKSLLIELMKNIGKRCISAGIHPLLHFEVHGSPDGLKLASEELVTWSELAAMFRQINVIIKNNLFVSMVTCYAARLFGESHPDQPAPYFGFIGSWDKIYEGYFTEDFYNFFDYLLSGSDFSKIDFAEALHILNKAHNTIVYSAHFGELIFDRIMREHHKLLAYGQHVDARAKEIVYNAQATIGRMARAERRKHERFTKKALKENKLEDEYRRRFLMLD